MRTMAPLTNRKPLLVLAVGIGIGIITAFPLAHALLREPEVTPVPDAVRLSSLLNQSQAALNSGNPTQALPLLVEADGIGFKNPTVQNNLCVAFNMLQRYDEGIEACRNALVLKPDFALARNNLAWARAQLAKSGGQPAPSR
jgi:tetratricopeptide (TPR) repeat protein